MAQNKTFGSGLIAGMLIMLAADAIHWFIGSWDPDVNMTRTILVALQAILSAGVAIWIILHKDRNKLDNV